jgi:acyl carrier protein
MTREEALEAFTEICRNILDDDEVELEESTTAVDVDGWDSVSHVQILVSVEERFDVRFSTGESAAMKNVGDLIQEIVEKSA